MASELELARLAAMANALRPDWPLQSVKTYLHAHAAGAFQDLAVALAWIATDPETDTPRRLAENGPWWAATRRLETAAPPPMQDPLAVPDADPDDPIAYARALRTQRMRSRKPELAARPTWCGKCDKYTRQVEDAGVVRRCPDCHPLATGAAS